MKRRDTQHKAINKENTQRETYTTRTKHTTANSPIQTTSGKENKGKPSGPI